MQEYVSVLILYASAPWVDKVRMLFALFDFDGSNSLSSEETAIMLSSVMSGLARVTGQAVPASKSVAGLAQQLTSTRALRLADLLSVVQLSELFPLLIKYTSEAKPLPSPFFVFHKQVHHSYTPTVTRESRSMSHRNSNFSRVDYSDSPRLRKSLPPCKGLVIVRNNQDGELVTKRKIIEVREYFVQMADRSGRLSVSQLLNSQELASNARRAADRLLRQMEGDGTVTLLGFLRLLYPRATNTQLNILHSWTGGGRQAETPSLLHGEFFIVPRQSTRGLPLIR